MAGQIVFIVISLLTLLAATAVVTTRNLFHAALAMMASFLGVAGLYVLLDMGFLAAAQLLVYIGAISILVIFAIMMTRRLMQTTEAAYNTQWLFGGLTAVGTFALLAVTVLSAWPDITRPVAGDAIINSLDSLGQALVSPTAYVLPFEAASVLLLAALVGAIVIAWPERKL